MGERERGREEGSPTEKRESQVCVAAVAEEVPLPLLQSLCMLSTHTPPP